MDKIMETLEDQMRFLKESTPQNSINHPEYIKGAIWATRYAIEAIKDIRKVK